MKNQSRWSKGFINTLWAIFLVVILGGAQMIVNHFENQATEWKQHNEHTRNY